MKYAEFASELERAGWLTPDTYSSRRFGEFPDAPGVYLFCQTEFDDPKAITARVMYVGMSLRLAVRYASHPVLDELTRRWCILSWFREVPRARLRETERELIQRYDPPFNIIGRRRGVAEA